MLVSGKVTKPPRTIPAELPRNGVSELAMGLPFGGTFFTSRAINNGGELKPVDSGGGFHLKRTT